MDEDYIVSETAYETLGVDPTATDQQIHDAAAREFRHFDLENVGDTPRNRKRLDFFYSQYYRLETPERREEYDSYLRYHRDVLRRRNKTIRQAHATRPLPSPPRPKVNPRAVEPLPSPTELLALRVPEWVRRVHRLVRLLQLTPVLLLVLLAIVKACQADTWTQARAGWLAAAGPPAPRLALVDDPLAALLEARSPFATRPTAAETARAWLVATVAGGRGAARSGSPPPPPPPPRGRRENPYDVLGVAGRAGDDDLARARDALLAGAELVGPGEAGRVQDAYDALRNPLERCLWDSGYHSLSYLNPFQAGKKTAALDGCRKEWNASAKQQAADLRETVRRARAGEPQKTADEGLPEGITRPEGHTNTQTF